MKNILIIEDTKVILEELVSLFKMEGYGVLSAKNGKIGIEKARKYKPDLIISDILMPIVDGYQVLKELQTEHKTSLIPFIFLSAKAENSEIRKGMNLGADDYITKPINPDDLLTAVNTKLLKKEKFDTQKKYYKKENIKIKKNLSKIKNKTNEIISGLEFAGKIQESIVKSSQINNISIYKDTFILNLPKDIVSGDFYWTHENKHETYIAAADCTGHGLSGALLTILGVTFLNQIVIEEKNTKPSEILLLLKKKIIKSIEDKNHNYSGSGMDIAFLKINWNKNLLEFSGANNPLWITRNKKDFKNNAEEYIITEKEEIVLIEIKPTKIPIANYPTQSNTFKNNIFKIIPGDHLYIFSDGYSDQFGGSDNKKFMTKQLKSTILDIKKLPVSQQKEKLKSTFYNWKGNIEQTDDVLIIGINIK